MVYIWKDYHNENKLIACKKKKSNVNTNTAHHV